MLLGLLWILLPDRRLSDTGPARRRAPGIDRGVSASVYVICC
ncbi:hypothetical protein [Salinicola tamaricis]|nr:hypothetical protein [Salinicola tamaricis]